MQPGGALDQHGEQLEAVPAEVVAGVLLSDTGEASSSLIQPVVSSNPAKGRGAVLKASHFADPAIDAMVERNIATFADAEREALYREATERAVAHQAFVPLFHQLNPTTSSRTVQLRPRQQDGIRAWEVDVVARGG